MKRVAQKRAYIQDQRHGRMPEQLRAKLSMLPHNIEFYNSTLQKM